MSGTYEISKTFGGAAPEIVSVENAPRTSDRLFQLSHLNLLIDTVNPHSKERTGLVNQDFSANFELTKLTCGLEPIDMPFRPKLLPMSPE